MESNKEEKRQARNSSHRNTHSKQLTPPKSNLIACERLSNRSASLVRHLELYQPVVRDRRLHLGRAPMCFEHEIASGQDFTVILVFLHLEVARKARGLLVAVEDGEVKLAVVTVRSVL